jgi:hypothetical protein
MSDKDKISSECLTCPVFPECPEVDTAVMIAALEENEAFFKEEGDSEDSFVRSLLLGTMTIVGTALHHGVADEETKENISFIARAAYLAYLIGKGKVRPVDFGERIRLHGVFLKLQDSLHRMERLQKNYKQN